MAGKNITLVGMSELSSYLRHIEKGIPAATASALYAAGNHIMRESKAQVPFRTGVLKSSGRVFTPSITGDSVVVDMGYGGAASDYALIVHESGYSFRNGKKSHYLADPVGDANPIINSMLIKAIGGLF